MAGAHQFSLCPQWEFVSDDVMGGVSHGKLHVDENSAARLTGTVSLENNGGFLQMAFDVCRAPDNVDPSGWSGIEIKLRGNSETYDIRLRTTDLTRPWQSYRTEITAAPQWQTFRLPFSRFAPHRTETELDVRKLRRIGVLAIGRVFKADITVASVGFF